MKATSLEQAIEAFGPAPIEFGPGGTSGFYVEREDRPLARLRTRLLSGTEANKYLLAGHRGSGKSTELNRLAADPEIVARYEVLKFSVKDVLDLNALTHIDLLFSCVARTYDQLVTRAGMEVGGRALDRLDRWRREITERIGSREQAASATVDTGAKVGLLSAFFAGFTARLRAERKTREVTREVVEPRLSEFLDTLDGFFRDVEDALAKGQRRLLLVLEDLDKIPDIGKALALFSDTGFYLTRPPCRIVYTVPIAIHYSKAFQNVAGTFGPSVFLPNIRLRERQAPHARNEAGVRTMRQFVRLRMDGGLVEEDALGEAVAHSGGVFQQLQRLMEDACVTAITRGAPVVTRPDVREAAAALRNQLERSLTDEDHEILAAVDRRKQASSDDATLALLHGLHLVEYRNLERWCDVNPLLEQTLRERERRVTAPP